MDQFHFSVPLYCVPRASSG